MGKSPITLIGQCLLPLAAWQSSSITLALAEREYRPKSNIIHGSA